MWVGGLKVELYISDGDSLKSKRSVIRSIKDRIRSNFNASVAEVGEQDKWQRAVLGVAVVGPDKRELNSVLDKVLDSIRQNGQVEILSHDMEIL